MAVLRQRAASLLVSIAVVSFALTAFSGAIAQTKSGARTLLVAEPGHGAATLPFNAAIAKGFFAEEGLDVRMLTVDGGSTHTNAVLSGQAFAFVGGPEHNAFAKLKGAELRAVANLNDRATAYLVAKKNQGPSPGQSIASYIRGKTIGVSFFGGTPNSILRYLFARWHLDPKTDATFNEMASSAVLASVKAGGSTVGVAPEPFVTQGVRSAVWDEPILNIPKELGPYAYTTLNVRLSSIRDEPETVRRFVKGVIRGLKFAQENREEIALIAKKEFPTMSADDLKATLDRSYADEAWSLDGTVSQQSWDTASAVVLEAGILKQPVAFDEVIDMQFVRALKATSSQ